VNRGLPLASMSWTPPGPNNRRAPNLQVASAVVVKLYESPIGINGRQGHGHAAAAVLDPDRPLDADKAEVSARAMRQLRHADRQTADIETAPVPADADEVHMSATTRAVAVGLEIHALELPQHPP